MNRVLLSAVALLGGCASLPTFPEPDARWMNYSGQLQYVTAERSVIGEFIASRRAGDFRLDVSKGGAAPLLRVARHGDLARAEGALARGRWSGNAGDAPAPLRAWVAEVPEAFARLGTATPQRLVIPGERPGEKIVLIFNR
ncbi:MAG: hypothetical protein ABMA13_08170 [Chthoniobacteraceae bacterium]